MLWITIWIQGPLEWLFISARWGKWATWQRSAPSECCSSLVNGNLVRGCGIVVGEGRALVGLSGLCGAPYRWIGRIWLGGRAAVQVLRGEERHICAQQVLLDCTHRQTSLRRGGWGGLTHEHKKEETVLLGLSAENGTLSTALMWNVFLYQNNKSKQVQIWI